MAGRPCHRDVSGCKLGLCDGEDAEAPWQLQSTSDYMTVHFLGLKQMFVLWFPSKQPHDVLDKSGLLAYLPPFAPGTPL